MRRGLIAPLTAVVLVLMGVVAASGQPTAPSEYQVKAAYLYNFGRFVEWPAESPIAPGGMFAICVLGRDPFGQTLDDTIAGVTIRSQTAAVKRVASAAELSGCRIVFIASSEEKQLRQILSTVDKNAVLTVSDIPDFSRRGGMIQFVMEGNRVRFEINLSAATDAKLTVSSDLLKVAAAVRGGNRPGR